MRQIDVHSVIENQNFNRFHTILIICCMFIIICDGYDMFMLGAETSSQQPTVLSVAEFQNA
jgi:AAHS family benzoate transporter-like MFS transporter